MTEQKAKSGIDGLCWGGFFLGPIWGVFNGVWISLLCFIPLLGLIMNVVLLLKGRQWAWEKKEWKDEAHFDDVQKTWSIVGLILGILGPFIIGILAAIAIPNFKNYGKRAKTSEAKIKLVNLYVNQMTYFAETGEYTSNPEALELNELNNNSSQKYYNVGFASHDPFFENLCPDCRVTSEGFKAMAVGNIDDDPDVDVWTIDHNKVITHIQKD